MDKFEEKLRQISEKARKRVAEEQAEAEERAQKSAEVLDQSLKTLMLTAQTLDQQVFHPVVRPHTRVSSGDLAADLAVGNALPGSLSSSGEGPQLTCTYRGVPKTISVTVDQNGKYLIQSEGVSPPLEEVGNFTDKKLEAAILSWLGTFK